MCANARSGRVSPSFHPGVNDRQSIGNLRRKKGTARGAESGETSKFLENNGDAGAIRLDKRV